MIPTAFADPFFAETNARDFYFKLDFDPTLFFFLFLGWFYSFALQKYPTLPIRKWQVTLFYIGIAINILCLIPPINPLADQLFFMHMIQHMLIIYVGVPLMIFGAPFYICLRALPKWFKKKVYLPLIRHPLARYIFSFFSKPLPVLILFQVTFIGWHIPLFYDLALYNDLFHLLEHASFAAAAILFWRLIVSPRPLPSLLPYPARMLLIAVMMASNILLSAFLTFAPRVLYGYPGIPHPDWWARGYLEDQQLGGLIMWVPGGVIHFIAMTICFMVWANKEQREDLQQARNPVPLPQN